jgi:hypothetical protein
MACDSKSENFPSIMAGSLLSGLIRSNSSVRCSPLCTRSSKIVCGMFAIRHSATTARQGYDIQSAYMVTPISYIYIYFFFLKACYFLFILEKD